MSDLDLSNASCLVCGEGYETNTKYVCCPGCSAPSHIDCYEYQGSCPVYACGYKMNNENKIAHSIKTTYVPWLDGKYEFSYRTDIIKMTRQIQEIPEGYRFVTAAEELAVQLSYENVGKDPRKAEEFKEFFIDMCSTKHPVHRQLTLTSLRTPKAWKHGRYDEVLFKNTGKKKFLREIIIEGEKIDEILVPEAENYFTIVTKWNEKYGIPEETSNFNVPHTTHFCFDPNKKEVDIYRCGVSNHNTDCIGIDATDKDPEKYYFGIGFRLIKGPRPWVKNKKGLWQKTKEIMTTDISDLF